MATALATCSYKVTTKRGDLVRTMELSDTIRNCSRLNGNPTAQQVADFIAELYGGNITVSVIHGYQTGSCELA